MQLAIVLVVAGAACAMVGAPAAAEPTAGVEVAAVHETMPGDTEAARARYARNARGEVITWRRRLRGAGILAAAGGVARHHAAGDALRTSWAKADTASRRLLSLNAKFWTRARGDYEKASRDLASAWDESHPQTHEAATTTGTTVLSETRVPETSIRP
jgi:ABC-type glycerol-3-phosphate transport system substrate-binding protein